MKVIIGIGLFLTLSLTILCGVLIYQGLTALEKNPKIISQSIGHFVKEIKDDASETNK